MAKRKAPAGNDSVMPSAFVPLPVRRGEVLRLLGPAADEAATVVDPLASVEPAAGGVRWCVAGVCDAAGTLVEPAEVLLVPVDEGRGRKNAGNAGAGGGLDAIAALPELHAKLRTAVERELPHGIWAADDSLSVLLYCRKRHVAFGARDAEDGALLPVVPADDVEQMFSAQGRIAELVDKLAADDPAAAEALAAAHACVRCPEHGRCYPIDDKHAYVLDRLVAVNAAQVPLVVRPLGLWRLDEACRVIGGLPAGKITETEEAPGELAAWRTQRAADFDSRGPARLLVGETDGRQLIEIVRLKLNLLADVLEQLDATWRASDRPHLHWNDETIRVSWRLPAAIPAMCWGLRGIVRKIGLQTTLLIETPSGRAMPSQPAGVDSRFLTEREQEPLRHFAQANSATVFVRAAQHDKDGADVRLVLEGLPFGWDVLCEGDAMHVTGNGWKAVLAPASAREDKDGDGLPFVGRATGDVSRLAKGEQEEGADCHWYPRYDEAVDLRAAGMLLLEALMCNDERERSVFWGQMNDDLAELERSCVDVPLAQRDEHVRGWIAQRADADAPASAWSRRNVMHLRADRDCGLLDGFEVALWREVMTLGLRMITRIAGFSYCADRSRQAPRLEGGLLLPLVELRGLIGLLDDRLFGRAAIAERVASVGGLADE